MKRGENLIDINNFEIFAYLHLNPHWNSSPTPLIMFFYFASMISQAETYRQIFVYIFLFIGICMCASF